MELVTSCKNSEELNNIRKCIVEQVLETPVGFSSYRIIGTDTQRMIVEVEEPITEHERNTIIRLMDGIKQEYKFLYCGYDLPIKQLRVMNKEYNKILNYKKLYYYDPGNISEELIMFAESFLKQFTYHHEKVNMDDSISRHTLGLRPLGLTNVTLKDQNGRIYLSDDGEEYNMDTKDLCQHLYNKMTESDEDIYYDIEDKNDKINIERVKKGMSPLMSVDNISNFQRFKIMLSFAKLCNEENYPMLNPVDIHEMFDESFGYSYYTLKFGKHLEEEFEDFEINYYKEHEYYHIEEALAFSIYLSGLRIKHFIFENKVLKSYTVSYSYIDLLEPYPNYDDMKKRVTDLYCDITGHTAEHVHGRYFHEMSLKSLLNCFIIDDTIVFRDYNSQHINPTTKSPLPVHYYDCIKYRSDGLYNVYDITKGIFKHYPLFDRSNLEVRDVDINMRDDKLFVHGVEVLELRFKDPERAVKHAHRCWKKGYFFTTFGLMYYMETGEISRHCIKRPVWFSFNNSNEKNLYEFLEFNNL